MDDFGDFDEDILDDQNIDNFENLQENGEEALNKLLEKDKSKPKKKRLNLAPRLTEKDLTGPKGYCALRKMFDGWKPTHKNPLDDVSNMIQKFEYWGHSLAPNMNFKDFMEKSMKLSKTRAVKTYMMKLRSGMPLFEDDDDKHNERSASPEEVAENHSKEPVDDFDNDVDDSAFDVQPSVDFESEWADAVQANIEAEKTQPTASSTILEMSDEEEERIFSKFRSRASPELSDLEDEQPIQAIAKAHDDDKDTSQQNNQQRKRRLIIESDDDEDPSTQNTERKTMEETNVSSQSSNYGVPQQSSKKRAIIESDDEDEQLDQSFAVEGSASQKENSFLVSNKKKRRLIIESDNEEDEASPKENLIGEEAAMDMILNDF